MASTRLPGKVLYEVAGRPLILFMIERVRRVSELDDVVIATSENEENDALAAAASDAGVSVFRGSEDDVLERFDGAAADQEADLIVRLTGDCPITDPEVISAVIQQRAADDLDYCCNVKPETWPDGLDVSVFTRETLARANREATLPSEREHVVPWMWRMSSLEGGALLRAGNLRAPEDLSKLRWTIDDARDYQMLRTLAARMAGCAACGGMERNSQLSRR